MLLCSLIHELGLLCRLHSPVLPRGQERSTTESSGNVEAHVATQCVSKLLWLYAGGVLEITSAASVRQLLKSQMYRSHPHSCREQSGTFRASQCGRRKSLHPHARSASNGAADRA
eukprot:4213517-Amphidinium_carterae.1